MVGAVTHVKSNAVADFTGTVTVFNSQGSTVTVAATDIVRPSDWNSGHHQIATLSGNTAGASTLSGTNIVIQGGNGLSVSGAQGANAATIVVSAGNYLTTAMASNAATLSNIRVSAGTTSNLLSAITLANGNGVTFGLDAGTLTASHNGLTTARASNDAIGLNTAVSNVTATINSAGLSLDARGYAGTATTFNGANVSASMTVNSVGVNISASVLAQSNQSVGLYHVGNTTGQSSSSTVDARSISFDGAGIVSVGMSGGSVRISATQSNQAFSADASSTFQTLSFQDSNGVSFSNNAGALRVTHALQFTSATSAITSNALHSSASRVINIVAATNNTGGGTASLSSNVSFSAANGVTFYTSAGGAVAASYSRNVASNAIQAVGSATGSGTNTSRFAPDDHVHEGIFSFGVSNDAGNTAGDTRVGPGRYVLRGGNNITLSQITAANALNTIVVSAGAGGGAFTGGMSNVGNTAGTSGTVQSQILVVGGPNITVSQSINGQSATLSISGNAPGAAAEQNAINLLGANTAGNTTATGSTLGFSGVNITLSGTNDSRVVISAPATSSLSATGHVSISVNGSTISIGAGRTLSQLVIAPLANYGGQVPFAQSSISLGQNSLYMIPVHLDEYFTADHIRMPVMVTNSSSGAASIQKGQTYQVGVYTRENSTRLSRLYSTSYTIAASHNSNASWMLSMITAIGNSTSYNTLSASSAGLNLSASLHGPREFIMPFSTLLTPGEYFFAVAASTSSVGGGGAILNLSNLAVAHQTFNRPGQSTSATNSGFYKGALMGTYSTTTGALPDTINNTQINQLGTVPILFAITGTV